MAEVDAGGVPGVGAVEKEDIGHVHEAHGVVREHESWRRVVRLDGIVGAHWQKGREDDWYEEEEFHVHDYVSKHGKDNSVTYIKPTNRSRYGNRKNKRDD